LVEQWRQVISNPRRRPTRCGASRPFIRLPGPRQASAIAKLIGTYPAKCQIAVWLAELVRSAAPRRRLFSSMRAYACRCARLMLLKRSQRVGAANSHKRSMTSALSAYSRWSERVIPPFFRWCPVAGHYIYTFNHFCIVWHNCSCCFSIYYKRRP
jgi:hypothetical protein